MNHYQAFGLNITADLSIRELLESANPVPDVVIQKAANPFSVELDDPQRYQFSGTHNRFLLHIPEVASFLIEKGNRITYRIAENVDIDSFRLFLLGSAMGALLQQRGLIVLHGNAISFDQQYCQIFIGHTGAGKSTKAAHCFQQGASILTDDVSAIYLDQNKQAWLLPSYPQIKLWQSSADLLKIDTTRLPRVRPQDPKYALKILEQFYSHPLRVKEVIEIDPQVTTTESITGLAKLHLLLTHSYRVDFLDAMNLKAPYIKKLLELAHLIEIKRSSRETIN